MRVMGIDPGLRLTGYACVDGPEGASGEGGGGGGGFGGFQGVEVVEAGVFRLQVSRPISERLVELERDLCDAIDRLRPEMIAVEKLFSHYKHPTTAAIMGHARGVVLLAITRAGLRLVELGATEVKKSMTGHGHAKKSQMQDAVMIRLGLATRPEPADVADAIAIACCALRRSPQERLTADRSRASPLARP